MKKKEAEFKKNLEEIEEDNKNNKRKREEYQEMVVIKKEKLDNVTIKNEEEMKKLLKEKDVMKKEKEGIEEKYKELEDATTCCICWDKRVNTTVLPCMHCYCETCVKDIKECASCRRKITSKRKIFMT